MSIYQHNFMLAIKIICNAHEIINEIVMRNFHFHVIHLVKLTSPSDIVDSCIFIVDYNYRQDGSNGSKAI